MKKEYTKADLQPDTEVELNKHFNNPKLVEKMHPILTVIAQCLDSAIKGSNSYVTFGITRDKKAIIMTVNYEGTKIFAAGATLAEVADKCADML